MAKVRTLGLGLAEEGLEAVVGHRINPTIEARLVNHDDESVVRQQSHQFPAHVVERAGGLIVIPPDPALHGYHEGVAWPGGAEELGIEPDSQRAETP